MEQKRSILAVKHKLGISILISVLWLAFSVWLGLPWLYELSATIGPIPAFLIVLGLAFIPGLANSFLIVSLFFDRRPEFEPLKKYPHITILIAAYNEEACIAETITSIAAQNYPGKLTVLIGNDGSVDTTRNEVYKAHLKYKDKFDIQLYSANKNMGKGMILNKILKQVKTKYCVTIDADTYLFKNALVNLVTNIIQGPPNTAAVAGSVLVRNSRDNWLTRVQEWDYFHGIAVVKRIQSLYQGTLVAQGAFSIYNTKALFSIGGWDNTVGEDIVLTWALREKRYRISYAEEAVSFTTVPDNYKQFFNQRKRWSRGLIEAFKKYPQTIWRLNMSSPFVWLNLTFPFNDFIFMFAFTPGVIAAICFQYYAIAGIMTLVLLPMSLMMNWVIYRKHTQTFRKLGLGVRQNKLGFLAFILTYQFMMVPASLAGYAAELFNLNKNWGTK